MRTSVSIRALVVSLAACGSDPRATPADAATPPDASAGDPVSIRFAAKVGDQDFACGQTYANLGTPAADFRVEDLRIYVHDVALLGGDGSRTAVALDQDGAFQRANLALLDFEDGGAGCPGGTAATHTVVTGRAPAGTYTGVEFVVGVPAELDHLDASTALPPLDDTTLWWVWRSGYKYLRLEGTANGSVGFPFHLGATGCPGASPVSAPSAPCAQPNLSTVTLRGFDPTAATIAVDAGALLATTNLGVNAAGSAQGCQSDPDDVDCGPVFARIGLPFGGAAPGPQVVFRAP
jgi:uncharacterized repeat protein (TIGR04052 family)